MTPSPFHAEDRDDLDRILGRQYHAVVGNPPYIQVKDKAQNAAYRQRYSTCHRAYSLGVPFTQRFFNLAVARTETAPAGFVGLITANSFMKREFGSKLIEVFFPHRDLTHIVDTASAYIPGHNTPTVILFGRNRRPLAGTIRAVMGISGEPGEPQNPAEGLVWTAILNQIDNPGSQSTFVSTADLPRGMLATIASLQSSITRSTIICRVPIRHDHGGRWMDMQLLRPIFHEARNAGRMVVMTADHGHVLEDGSRQAVKGMGDRWRPMDVAADGEMAFTGARVLSPDGAKEVVVPWSELLRYGGKKAGYHGGATPQEVLVPLAGCGKTSSARCILRDSRFAASSG